MPGANRKKMARPSLRKADRPWTLWCHHPVYSRAIGKVHDCVGEAWKQAWPAWIKDKPGRWGLEKSTRFTAGNEALGLPKTALHIANMRYKAKKGCLMYRTFQPMNTFLFIQLWTALNKTVSVMPYRVKFITHKNCLLPLLKLIRSYTWNHEYFYCQQYFYILSALNV